MDERRLPRHAPTHTRRQYDLDSGVADIIRKDRDYVARQCANGALKAKKLGNDCRIDRTSVDAFVWGLAPAPTRRRSRAS